MGVIKAVISFYNANNDEIRYLPIYTIIILITIFN